MHATNRLHFLCQQFSLKENPLDKDGQLALTVGDDSNPWWVLLKEAVAKAGGKLDKVEIFPAVTDLRYVRHVGIPGFGFSPLANTPLLAHGHNEVSARVPCNGHSQDCVLNFVLNIIDYHVLKTVCGTISYIFALSMSH